MQSISDALQAAIDAGYRPGAKARTLDELEVRLFSHPYTDGLSIKVLVHTRPGDPSSWKELEIEELEILPD